MWHVDVSQGVEVSGFMAHADLSAKGQMQPQSQTQCRQIEIVECYKYVGIWLDLLLRPMWSEDCCSTYNYICALLW